MKKDEDSLSDFVVDESESEDDDWRVRFLFRFTVGIKVYQSDVRKNFRRNISSNV